MNKPSESHDRQLDDQFSEFTDLLLSSGDETVLQKSMNDDSLMELKRTAIRMKAAARMAHPNSATSARVRARLLKEWKQQSEQPKRWAFLKTIFAPAPLPRFVMAGGLVALLLLSVVTFVIPVSPPLTGAALMTLQSWTPLFILLGVILIIALFWLDHRK